MHAVHRCELGCAGPRDTIYFNPPDVTAAIVTCGGLCPGLNDVVQSMVFTLSDYGVRDENILGEPPSTERRTLVATHACVNFVVTCSTTAQK